jgi:hypothetical protein
MPIEDDGPCFFCGKTLWNLDGLLVCEQGCGAYERHDTDNRDERGFPGIEWVVPQ